MLIFLSNHMLVGGVNILREETGTGPRLRISVLAGGLLASV
jgi:hypothetical protein